MRKGTAFILLFSFLLSHTELHQFFKIPVLVEHFKEHRAEDPSITFFQFLKLHYNKIIEDADYQRDQQLPFRDAECAVVITFISDTPPQQIRLEREDFQNLETTPPVGENLIYASNFSASIFQPPPNSLITLVRNKIVEQDIGFISSLYGLVSLVRQSGRLFCRH
ncbi:MAG: hypothetical protein GC171_06460 [Terrimonas sp.]|nr:hypothetical protein [Terrimonas sp.]